MNKIKRCILILLMIVCLGGIIYSSYHILTWKKNVDTNAKIKEEMKDSIQVKKDEEEKEKYIVDFPSLKEHNPDTIAYLTVPNTKIDYIVVRGNDNSYYLKHNFHRQYNIAGWIFSDYKNKFDGTDKNIVIFGHDTKDGSMFETLKNTLKEEWYTNSNNHVITLVTEEGTYLYQVFSNYVTIPEDYYIHTEFSSEEEYLTFLKEIKSRSIYDYGVEIDTNDTILTLSTCTAGGTKRVALHAKKIN